MIPHKVPCDTNSDLQTVDWLLWHVRRAQLCNYRVTQYVFCTALQLDHCVAFYTSSSRPALTCPLSLRTANHPIRLSELVISSKNRPYLIFQDPVRLQIRTTQKKGQ